MVMSRTIPVAPNVVITCGATAYPTRPNKTPMMIARSSAWVTKYAARSLLPAPAVRAITDEEPVPIPPANANNRMVNGNANPIAARASVPTIPR